MSNISYKWKNFLLTVGFVFYMLFSLLIPLIMYQLRDNNRLILMDGSNSYHITEYADKEKLLGLYEYTARLATDALWMRNPNGLDRPTLFDEMYTGVARNKALDILKADVTAFGARDVHQKVEILRIKVLEADSRKSFVEIEGQLLRSSLGDGRRESSVVKFSVTMSLSVNFDLGKNALYPFIVSDFTYKEQAN